MRTSGRARVSRSASITPSRMPKGWFETATTGPLAWNLSQIGGLNVDPNLKSSRAAAQNPLRACAGIQFFKAVDLQESLTALRQRPRKTVGRKHFNAILQRMAAPLQCDEQGIENSYRECDQMKLSLHCPRGSPRFLRRYPATKMISSSLAQVRLKGPSLWQL